MPCSGRGLERGDEVHADGQVRQEVGPRRRFGARLVDDQDVLRRHQPDGRLEILACRFEHAGRDEPVRVEPRERFRGVLPREWRTDEEQADQRVQRARVRQPRLEHPNVRIGGQPLLQPVRRIAGRDEKRAQHGDGLRVFEAQGVVGRCVRRPEDTWSIRYRCRSRGVAQPG